KLRIEVVALEQANAHVAADIPIESDTAVACERVLVKLPASKKVSGTDEWSRHVLGDAGSPHQRMDKEREFVAMKRENRPEQIGVHAAVYTAHIVEAIPSEFTLQAKPVVDVALERGCTSRNEIKVFIHGVWDRNEDASGGVEAKIRVTEK